jgi:DNA-binding MarR family transcriptional regulator
MHSKQSTRDKPAAKNAPSQLGQTLMLTLQDFQHRLDEDLKSRGVKGIRSRHRSVFLHLGQHGASRAADLARALGIRPQSMMKIVQELEAMGFVQRKADPNDSRAKLVDFSSKGRKFVTELSRSTETVWQEYAAILGKKDMRTTITNLNKLLDTEAG